MEVQRQAQFSAGSFLPLDPLDDGPGFGLGKRPPVTIDVDPVDVVAPMAGGDAVGTGIRSAPDDIRSAALAGADSPPDGCCATSA